MLRVSVSMYRSQVDRLTREIADLRKKVADENGRVHDQRSKAQRAVSSITKNTSDSTARSKLRDAERYEKAAVGHEKRAAQIDGQIASKQRSLSSAQTSLERALTQERQKEDREAERRRRAEIDHIRELERQRRALDAWPMSTPASPRTRVAARPSSGFADEVYDICLSFAGEQRGYVELVAGGLKAHGLQVFYDQDEDVAARLWGRDLTEYLDYVYRQGSQFCILFISREYAEKEWTRLERRSALDRAMREESEYLLPARFDDTELPGLRPSVGYVDLQEVTPAGLVEFVLRKLGRLDSDA